MFWDTLFSNIKFTFDFIDRDIEMTATGYITAVVRFIFSLVKSLSSQFSKYKYCVGQQAALSTTTIFFIFHQTCQSFVTTAPLPPPSHLRGRVGDSRAKVQGDYFSSVLSVQGK